MTSRPRRSNGPDMAEMVRLAGHQLLCDGTRVRPVGDRRMAKLVARASGDFPRD